MSRHRAGYIPLGEQHPGPGHVQVHDVIVNTLLPAHSSGPDPQFVAKCIFGQPVIEQDVVVAGWANAIRKTLRRNPGARQRVHRGVHSKRAEPERSGGGVAQVIVRIRDKETLAGKAMKGNRRQAAQAQIGALEAHHWVAFSRHRGRVARAA